MNFYLINLIQSCNTLHELKRELEKPLGWFRFRSKKKAKELEEQLNTAISDIVYKDVWDIQYLYDLERMFFVFYKDLKDYMLDITIPGYDPNNYNPKNFYPIYFYDEKRNTNIIIEIIATNISFTIFDINTGRNIIQLSSADTVQSSQRRAENKCKEILINTLRDFLYENKLSEEEKAIEFAKRY